MPLTHRRRSTVDLGRQLGLTLLALGAVLVAGTVGYVLLGVGWLDAAYATVFTVTTVGFKEIVVFGPAQKVFTIVLMLVGTGTVLYTLTLLVAALVEGRVGSLMGRRRMQREIDALSGHTIVCGFGRVGKAAALELGQAGRSIVIVDVDEERLVDCEYPFVLGDASSDRVLQLAGVQRAESLVASLDNDADSLYVTLSARALSNDLLIIARARTDDAEKKFTRAGADRVVNPQRIGGDRIAAFALQQHVVDFLDVAMHDAGMEFRMEDVQVEPGSALAGSTVRTTREHEGGGALLLALRDSGGQFVTNPPSDQVINPGDVMIAVGTAAQLTSLRLAAQR
ncbi:MAG: NAD-binding protein [Actinomycetes bacterium]